MGTQVDSKIDQLLSLKGKTRLEVKSKISQKILEFDFTDTPGISLRFLETKKKVEEFGSWNEFNILLEIPKLEETSNYLGYVILELSKFIKRLGLGLNIDSIGIQEINCSNPNYYYILLYILSDGKDAKKELIFSDSEQ